MPGIKGKSGGRRVGAGRPKEQFTVTITPGAFPHFEEHLRDTSTIVPFDAEIAIVTAVEFYYQYLKDKGVLNSQLKEANYE